MPTIYSKTLEMSYRNCKRSKCEVKDCKLHLHGFPLDKVIINVDCVLSSKMQGERCDFVIAVDEGKSTYFLPVEFKSKGIDCAKIKKQLEGGIRFFENELPNNFKCHPMLVSTKLTKQDRRHLEQTLIEYGTGAKKRIAHVSCNNTLGWSKVKK